MHIDAIDKPAMTSIYAGGFKPVMAVRQLAVKVCGDAALVTCYLEGSLTSPEMIESGTWRYSEMLVRQDGEWKGFHFHWSLLTPEHSISKP